MNALFFTILATVIEGVVEHIFGTPFNKFPKLEPYKWLLQYIAAAVGIFVFLHYQVDLIAFLASQIDVDIEPSTLGYVLTGILVGRGGEVVHKIISLVDNLGGGTPLGDPGE